MVCQAEVGMRDADVTGVQTGVLLAVRPQLGALKVPLPGGRLVTPKVTVPLGLVASAGTVTVSWTVAVQVDRQSVGEGKGVDPGGGGMIKKKKGRTKGVR